MSNLAQLRDRIELLLLDQSNQLFPTDLLDEALRQALDEYNEARPQEMETVLELPGDGREIALNKVGGLRKVLDVWWPYDSTAIAETWPPNRVHGFRLLWDDIQPVLFLDLLDGPQPQAGDEMRLWYIKRQTIENLDAAGLTTLPPEHESPLCLGAAGQAALARSLDLMETPDADMYAAGLLGAWGSTRLKEYRVFLRRLGEQEARSGPAWSAGWRLDRWDGRER